MPKTHKETSNSIASWAEDVFGPAEPLALVRRARVEFDELEQAIIEGEPKKAILSEIADVAILLHRLAHDFDGSLEQSVKDKMKINRARKWVKSNDGTGCHK